jgi:hypothetical protein
MRGAATAGLCGTGLCTGAWLWGALLAGVLAMVFGAVFGAAFEIDGFETGVFEAGALEAACFKPVAFAAVFAVLFGIALLLFFEDLAADALAVRPSLREVRARLLVAPRLTAAVFLLTLEALFLRVFCDTACARNCHAPVRCFSREPIGAKSGLTGSANVPNIAHFPQKSTIYAQGGAFGRQFADQTGVRVKPKRVLVYMFLRELDTGSHMISEPIRL